jgi:putative membrane protein
MQTLFLFLAQAAEPAAEWSGDGAPLWAWLVDLGLLGALALLVVQGVMRRRDYRGGEALGPASLDAVHTALVEAEKRTVGEIVPVVLDRSDRYPAADLWCAVVFAVASYLSAWVLPVTPGVQEMLLVALGGGLLGWALARALPELRRRFVAPWRMTEMAEEQAFQEFFAQGLHRTEAKTGVLLFVSLLERRVIVMADEGIDAVVPRETWDEVRELVLAEAREGRLGAGLTAAVGRIGELLADEFPWAEGDRNEVPDRVVVRVD